MKLIRIDELDPHAASEDELGQVFELHHAVRTHDLPEDDPPTYASVTSPMKAPDPVWGRLHFFAARIDGRMQGVARVALMANENRDWATVEILVHPEHRRRGIGTELLGASLPVIEADGRRTVALSNVVEGSPGEAFGLAHGFVRKFATVAQRLLVADAVAERAGDVLGYHFVAWTDRAPDELVESFAAARTAIADAPIGESKWRHPEWTAERVRQDEREVAETGTFRRTVVAVADDTGEVAGLTELHMPPHRPNFGYQGDTAVLARHRGHRLGHALKVEMLRWLIDENGRGISQIWTSTAVTNTHMIGINHELGYRTMRTAVWLLRDLAELSRRLDVTVAPGVALAD
jgi:mycothiol synthase